MGRVGHPPHRHDMGAAQDLATIYRLYDVPQAYGPALKALIHKDFGDGIMGAITFNLALERRETEQGRACALPWTASSLPSNGRADARARPSQNRRGRCGSPSLLTLVVALSPASTINSTRRREATRLR